VVRFFGTILGTLALLASHAFAEEIHLAARKGDVAAIEKLLGEGIPVDLPSTRNTSLPGMSALYVAAQFGRFEAAQALLSAGADPTMRPTGENTDGTPMHMAARGGKIEIVVMFLDHGVDPNIYDRWLGTPLHQARLNENEELATLLISRGAVTEWQAPSIVELIANADVENGRAIAKGCATICHSITAEDHERSLWNILGAQKASRPGYDYSKAFASLEGNWTYADLNSFIASPSRFAPGSRMPYSLQDDVKRADLIAYLRSLSDNPLPIP